ncbi:MAG: hypothetical protein ACD_9C00268G0007 [uncultured bacterium]|nr:MAG: hypothetical protein ACD_9C00268G0007 [uncultured bacterium]
MKNKKGNVAVVALIIVIVAITASVITWQVATKTQAPEQKEVATTPQPEAQSLLEDESTNWKTYTYSDSGLSLKYPPEKLGDNNLPGFASTITFDKQTDGLGGWAISSQNAQELLVSGSCDILKNKSEKEGEMNSNFYLPDLFNKPNICAVIKSSDRVIYYAIGKNNGFEGLPSIDAGLLIIEKNRAVIVNGLLGEGINEDMQSWTDTYLKNHPGVEFPNSEFNKLLPLANSKADELLQIPSAKMNANFSLLKEIATSIK